MHIINVNWWTKYRDDCMLISQGIMHGYEWKKSGPFRKLVSKTVWNLMHLDWTWWRYAQYGVPFLFSDKSVKMLKKNYFAKLMILKKRWKVLTRVLGTTSAALESSVQKWVSDKWTKIRSIAIFRQTSENLVDQLWIKM